MLTSSLIVAFLCVGVGHASLPLPSYIKPCARSDPGFEACALQRAQETIKNIVNGDRKYKIPPIDPLEVTEISVDNEGPKQAGIEIKLKKAKFHGLKDTIFKDVKINYDKKTIHLDLELPHLEIEGDYEISGRILLLPITGKGPFNFKLDTSAAQFDTDWIVEKRDGKEFLKLTNSRISSLKPQKVRYEFQNLFNGDSLLGTEMNNVLNQNWKEAFQELSPPVIQGMSTVIAGIVNNIASVVEYDDIFPLKL